MAEFWSNNDRGYSLRVRVDTQSQNIENNTSQVRVQAHLLNGAWTFAGYTITASVTIDGQTLNYSGSPAMLSNNSSLALIDKVVTISHNDDGNKTASVSARLTGQGGYSPNTLTIGTQGYQLTNIPRASPFTMPASTQFGGSLKIIIQPVKESYTHTVRYVFGTVSGTIATNVKTEATWKTDVNLMNQIPDNKSGYGTVYVDTYNGSTKLGTKEQNFTLNVPDYVGPYLKDFTISEASSVMKSKMPDGPFVQILSNLQISFGESNGAYGSKVVGYRAEIVGKNKKVTQNNGTFGMMDYSGQIKIRAVTIDSRGVESAPKEKMVTVMPYHSPALSFTVSRGGSDQATLNITRNARIAPLTVDGKQKNRMNLRFYVAKSGSNTFTSANGPAGGEWTSISEFTNSMASLTGNYPGTNSFTVKGVLSDLFTSTEFIFQVPTEKVVISYTPDGVGVMKPRERGALDVKGEIYVNDKPIQLHQLTSIDGRSTYNASKTLDLNTKTVNSFFSCNEPKNGPYGDYKGQFFVAVYSESDKYLSQDLIEKGSGRRFVRTRQNGVWSNWVEYAIKENQATYEDANVKLPWGLTAHCIRKGNLVTIDVNRTVTNIVSSYDFEGMAEKLPGQYIPMTDTSMLISAANGKKIVGHGVLRFNTNGDIFLTVDEPGNRIWQGSVTYFAKN